MDPALPGRRVFGQAVIPVFTGVFDGEGHVISHLVIQGGGNLGLFGYLPDGAEVRNIGVVDVNITGSAGSVGGLVGQNRGSIATSYSTGSVNGTRDVGGLVGWNYPGRIVASSSSGSVSGAYSVGGLVGRNWGSIATSYSTGSVNGTDSVGGLVGSSGTLVFTFYGSPLGVATSVTITNSYSTASVSGDGFVGGLVGVNLGRIAASYSTGSVSGTQSVGGLVGSNTGSDSGYGGTVTACFWDIQVSRRATSAAGTGKTTAEMQTASIFLEAGWDFVGETANGTEEIWWILEGKDYPRLWWEIGDGALP